MMCGVMLAYSAPKISGAEYAKLYSQNFENEEINSVPSELVCSKSANIGVKSTSKGKMLEIAPIADGVVAFAEYKIKSGKNVGMDVSLKFVQNEVKTSECVLMRLKNAGKDIISIETLKDGSVGYRTKNDTFIPIIDSYVAGKTYLLRAEVDFASESAAVYVDGSLKVSKLPLINSAETADTLKMSAKYSPGFMVDDIVISNNLTVEELNITGDTSISIPNEGEYSYFYDTQAVDENGNLIYPSVTWHLAAEYEGITLENTENKAKITVNASALPKSIVLIAQAGEGSGKIIKRITIEVKTAQLAEIKINGSAKITSYNKNLNTYAYTADFYDKNGNKMKPLKCIWSLEAEGDEPLCQGIEIDPETGAVKVSGVMPKDVHIYVKVQAGEFSAKKKVTLLDYNTYRNDEARFNALTDYIDRVIEYGTDPYSDTPLIADAISVHTHLPMEFIYPADEMHQQPVATSNLPMQSNLYRTMEGISNLTGDTKYYDNMIEAYKYYLENCVSPSGLFYWGGHAAVDLKTGEITLASGNEYVHEMKNHSPYLDPFFKLDKEFSGNMVIAAWDGHMTNWNTLLFNRHADLRGAIDTSAKSDWYTMLNRYDEDNVGVVKSRDLPFRIAANDLIYFALNRYKYFGDKESLTWSTRLLDRYYAVQDENTHLGAYQFTTAYDASGVKDLPEGWGDMDVTEYTYSSYGDRAKNQFEEDLLAAGYITQEQVENEEIREYRTMFITKQQRLNPFTDLELAEVIGTDTEKGKKILEETVINLANYGKLAYIPEKNKFYQMFADGTIITGFELKKNGYYGTKGSVIGYLDPDDTLLASYMKTYLKSMELKGDEYNEYRDEIWKTIKGMAQGFGLGNLGDSAPGDNMSIDFNTSYASPGAVIGLCYLYRGTGICEYLDLARAIASNFIETKTVDGFFNDNTSARYIQLSGTVNDYGYALCLLEAAIRDEWDLVPVYYPCEGYYESKNVDEDDGRIKRDHMDTLLFSKTKQAVNVKEILVPEKEVNMLVGETKLIDITIEPDDATSKTVTWSSTDYSCVTFDTDAKSITARKAGNASIVLTAADGAVKTVINVTVQQN